MSSHHNHNHNHNNPPPVVDNLESEHSLLSPPSPVVYQQLLASNRSRSRSRDADNSVAWGSPPVSPIVMRRDGKHLQHEEQEQLLQANGKKKIESNRKETKKAKKQILSEEAKRYANCVELGKKGRKENDEMVYLDGPRIYTCAECRTHLTSHDEIISKSFHGRHGRAYLFEACVNHTIGPPEDRRLITGLHSVCDLFCSRCKTLIGWTYTKAYEPSQKYKEGKFIIEKINLHMEDSGSYGVDFPAGERRDRWKMRSKDWGTKRRNYRATTYYDGGFSHQKEDVYEYHTNENGLGLSSIVTEKEPAKTQDVHNGMARSSSSVARAGGLTLPSTSQL